MDVGTLERNKDKFLEYNQYFEQIARDSKLINHTDDDKHFVRYTINEVFAAKHNQLKSPFLGLETPSIKIKNNVGDNVQAVWRGAIIIGHGYEKGNFTKRDEALDVCFYVFLKILAKINADRRTLRIVQFDLDNLQANPVFDFFGGARAGVRWEFEMNAQFDLGYYERDWRNVQNGTPQPPFAEVFDQGQWNELQAGDRYSCSSSAGTLTLRNSVGDIIATYSVPPGALENEVTPDGDARINATDIGTYGKVPSNGEKNISVVNSADEEKGALNGSGKWEIEDSVTTINSQNAGPNGTVPAGSNGNIRVVNENNTEIGQLNANDDWEAPRGLVRFRDSLNNIIATGTAPPGANDDTVVADVEHTDSDGSAVPLPIGTPMVCTPPPSAPLNPPSFADAVVLYRSDSTFTLVNNLIDVWPDSSGNGYHASPDIANDNYRLSTGAANLMGFKDVICANNTRFSAIVPEITGTLEEFTLVFHGKRISRNYPGTNTMHRIGEFGDVNIDTLFQIVLINDDIRFYVESGSNRADYLYGYGNNVKMIVVYDGSQAVASDRFKVYMDGVEVSPHNTAGSFPPSITNTSDKLYLNTLYTSQPTSMLKNITAFWNRKFTTQEISEVNQWMTEIWG